MPQRQSRRLIGSLGVAGLIFGGDMNHQFLNRKYP
jgi:hypothetical protein